MLEQEQSFYLKPEELSNNFRIFPFSNVIINDKVLIYQHKIFYLQKEKLLPNGILDMEDLTEKYKENDEFEMKLEFVNGLFEIEGSD